MMMMMTMNSNDTRGHGVKLV